MRIIFILGIFFNIVSINAQELMSDQPIQSIVCPEHLSDSNVEHIDDELLAKSGCCSWHGGVCGCSDSRAKCCDGTLSPSCGCYGNMPIG